MSYEQFKAYADGLDINKLGLVAELNHFTPPDFVLEKKNEIALNSSQFTKIKTIDEELKRKMKEMGGMIINNEKVLDSLFRTKKIDDGTLIFYANRYGLYQGELRNAILQAYLKTDGVLSPGQKKKLEQLYKP